MELADVLAVLRAQEAALRARGIESLSVFGSVARGEAGPGSDVDLAAKLDPRAASELGLSGLARIADDMARMLDRKVDLVSEHPWAKARFKADLDRDRAVAF